jgi:hypothetical protein
VVLACCYYWVAKPSTRLSLQSGPGVGRLPGGPWADLRGAAGRIRTGFPALYSACSTTPLLHVYYFTGATVILSVRYPQH